MKNLWRKFVYINTNFERGDTVYLKTDKEKTPHIIIIGITIYIDNSIKYIIANNGYGFIVFEQEITKEAPIAF